MLSMTATTTTTTTATTATATTRSRIQLFSARPRGLRHRHRHRHHNSRLRASSSWSPRIQSLAVTASASAVDVFMDIEINGEPAGRLGFALRPDLAPRTVENFKTLAEGSQVGVTPALTYKGCAFEPYSGKYSYTCKGNGKHIFGAGKFVEREVMSGKASDTARKAEGAGRVSRYRFR